MVGASATTQEDNKGEQQAHLEALVQEKARLEGMTVAEYRDLQEALRISTAAEAKRVKTIKNKLTVKKVGHVRMKVRKVKILTDGRCFVRSLAQQAYVRNPMAFRVFLLKKLGLWLSASRQWNFATVSLKGVCIVCVWCICMYVLFYAVVTM